MKEIGTNTKDAIEIIDQKQIKKKLIGSQRRIPGLTLWQFNFETKELTKAAFKKVELRLSFKKTDLEKRYQVVIEENCTYLQALNLKNAKKVLYRNYRIAL